MRRYPGASKGKIRSFNWIYGDILDNPKNYSKFNIGLAGQGNEIQWQKDRGKRAETIVACDKEDRCLGIAKSKNVIVLDEEDKTWRYEYMEIKSSPSHDIVCCIATFLENHSVNEIAVIHFDLNGSIKSFEKIIEKWKCFEIPILSFNTKLVLTISKTDRTNIIFNSEKYRKNIIKKFQKLLNRRHIKIENLQYIGKNGSEMLVFTF